MKNLLSTDIGRLRAASLLDGISYLILLGIAMPMKYFGGIPTAVRYPGMIHGGLFIALCVALIVALSFRKIPLLWAAVTFLCALVPLAPFFLDRKLRSFQNGGA
ncbi:MAG: DUF3817 domain-containing protein [Verrucomicrobiales bacterium]|nr:DUF3817 domain-containing protein [Verrucomicrobiales bacterium]